MFFLARKLTRMSKASSKMMQLRGVLLFIVLVSPVAGQFTLPFLYMPLKRLFSDSLGSSPKHEKVTTEHVRILRGWSLEKVYNETVLTIFDELSISGFFSFQFTAANLKDLNYQWSYEIPLDDINSSFVDQRNVLTPADYQEELLKFTGKKFHFTVNKIASRLGIPAINLSHSYDPSDWDTVVHAMIEESTMAFREMLQLPSLDSLAQLAQIETQQLFTVNLSTFEGLVFPFPPKKYTLDTNTTFMIFNLSGITEDSYSDSTLTRVLPHAEINLSLQQFAILYNKSDEQAKTIDRTTLNQIYHMCDISAESILNMTLPEVSGKVVGSVNQSPPCPVLINIKGKPIVSFQSDSVVITEDMTVLEIAFLASSLPWRTVHWALDASLSEWEYLDAVSLRQLAEIAGRDLESLRNESVSESVKIIFSLKENSTLDSKTEIYRVFIKGVLKREFNLSLNEVAIFNEVSEGSLQNVSSKVLFRSFLNATVIHFKVNLSEIISAVQMTEEQLFSLPRQEWNYTISVIIDAVVTMEAAKLQMPTEKLLQLLDVTSDELSITQLKELIRINFQDLKQKKIKFENDPISWFLANNSVSDADYLNSSVLTLLLSASGFNSEELELVYDLNSHQIFILRRMRFSQLSQICGLDNSATKDRTAHSITEELTGIKESLAVCENTRFYLEARLRNMSYLHSAFNILANSSISFVNLVEMVTELPWRQNIWPFGLKMEDWTVLYVLNQDTFQEVIGITVDTFLSRTLLQIFESSIQVQNESNQAFLDKVNQARSPTLNILYKEFNTDEDELIQFAGISKAQYDNLLVTDVVSYVFQYLVAKFNVSLKSLGAKLNLEPGNLEKLSPTEWMELIPFVRAEVIRSGKQQLGVTLSHFAMLLQETSDSLQTLTLAQIESKWDSVFARLLRGKSAMEKETILEIINSIGITVKSLLDVTVLDFIDNRINLTKSDLVLLYNFSSVGIGVLENYTFMELPLYCELSKDDIFNKLPHELTVSMLGHNDDMTCRKIALVVTAATKTVEELATKFNFEVKNNISTLMMFQTLFQLPWPKIAWAVNASLADWPVLGAISLNDIADITSETADDKKLVRSFREVTMELLALPSNSYTSLLNDYSSQLLNKASSIFNVNASLICDGCNILDILWNSLKQLKSEIDFNPNRLPSELNVSPYEFNLTIPSRWSLLVLPIVRDAYSRAARVLGMDPDRLSTLLDVPAEIVRNMSLQNFQDLLEDSIRPLIDAKTSLMSSTLLDLVTAKGTNLAALLNESIFDVVDLLVSVPVQNISFIFNWTVMERTRLRNYTLDDILYYREVGLRSLADGNLLSFANFILKETLFPRTTSTPTLAPCKRGLTNVSNGAECTGNLVFKVHLFELT